MEQRLSIVTLGVADLERSRRFYEAGLGWTASPASQDGVTFYQVGGMVLALYPRSALAEDMGADGTPARGFAGLTLGYNTRSREEACAVLASAAAAGGTIIKPAADTFWGGHGGYFADLDGHAWEVSFNPFWPLLADGSVQLPGKA
ncbi:MAG: VOC family protein [Alphaproteobacteria bacterium]